MRKWRKFWSLFFSSLCFGMYVGSVAISLMKTCYRFKDDSVTARLEWKIYNEREFIWNYSDTVTDEYKSDEFLFVGVMTDRKFLDSRARAINLTWAHRVPGKTVFFIGEGDPYKGDLNVVELKGISENAYPPQKKSFAMLQYIASHYAGRYKWLMRADDDVYVKADELSRFLKSIDDRHFRYIGQPGYGRQEEKGRLGLSKAFCMGGPGVIMSGPLLRNMTSHFASCVHHVETSHEDTELGRCIDKAVGLSCTQAYEMQHLFYQNYEELHLPNSSFKKDLGKPELHALTLHPVKEAAFLFRLDNFIHEQKIQVLNAKRYRLSLETKMNLQAPILPHKAVQAVKEDVSHIKPIGYLHGKHVNLDNITSLPQREHHIRPFDFWECVKGTTIHSPRLVSARMIFPTRHRGRDTVKQNIIQTVNQIIQMSESPRRKVNFTNFQYQKLSTSLGIVGLVFVKSNDNGVSRSRPFLYKLPFGQDVAFRESVEAHDKQRHRSSEIVLVMAVSKRSNVYENFLSMYKKAVSDYSGLTELRVVVFKDEEKEHETISLITKKFKEANPSLKINILFSTGDFSRGKGLMHGVQGVSDSSLVLFMDSDMTFSSRFLHRASLNTVKGRQAFFPIYFTRYNPSVTCYKKKDCDVPMESREQDVGFWRSYSYGIGSIYKSDFVRCGGFRTNITGWGLEDVELYEKCLSTGLVMMRVIDPGIVHRYHSRTCDETLPEKQLESCRTSGAKMMGSVKKLGGILENLGIG